MFSLFAIYSGALFCKLWSRWSPQTFISISPTQRILWDYPTFWLSQQVHRDKFKAYFICFLSLRDHSPSLSDVQVLVQHFQIFCLFFFFLILSGESINLVLFLLSWPKAEEIKFICICFVIFLNYTYRFSYLLYDVIFYIQF